MTDAHVVAVVLNWEAAAETVACVRSLLESDWPRLTVLVVDNGSRSPVAPRVREQFAAVEVLRSEVNLGFAGGMNAGVRRALELDADYVLLMNNDTVADPSMVRALVDAAEQRPDAGIVSPLELFRDRPDIIASAGLRCDLRRGYQGRPLRQGERDTGGARGVDEVDSSAGTAMLAPASAIRDVGLLDEQLYLYIEDVDWSMRMRRAGRRVYVTDRARVWHGVSVSSGGEHSPRIAYYHARNSFVVCSRHKPLRGPHAALRHAEILATNLAHARRASDPVQNARAVLQGWRDYLRGRLGPRPGDAAAAPGHGTGA